MDLELIKRLRIILIAISCGHPIDADKFKSFSHETAKLYVKLYPWYHMPTTLHKMLAHGHQLIKASILPVGKMCEEAQEASNKEIRRLRRDHSRKKSRTTTMQDIFNGLLVASDPIISSFRKAEKNKKVIELPTAVKELLMTNETEKNWSETEDEVETLSD